MSRAPPGGGASDSVDDLAEAPTIQGGHDQETLLATIDRHVTAYTDRARLGTAA